MELMNLRRGLMAMGIKTSDLERLKGYIVGLNNLFNTAVLPETVELDFSGFDNIRYLESLFVASSGVKNVRIKNLRSTRTNMSIRDIFYYNTSITAIEFVNCDFSPQNWSEAFRTTTNVETISGELDFTNATNVAHIFNGDTKLREVRFKANTLKISIAYINTSPLLSDASLISIANGLNGSVTGQSITLHATPKARCSEIMGVNSSGTFIASDSGTLSLADFITTVKGWTLA